MTSILLILTFFFTGGVIGISDQNNDPVFEERTSSFYFSNKEQKDNFKVYVLGDSYEDARLHLSVSTSDGRLLYSNSCGLYDMMLTQCDLETMSKEEALKELLDNYFHNSFSSPAIAKDHKYDTMYSSCSKEVWERLQKDEDIIGFCFALEHSGICIAYVDNQVIIYEACC
ncbi:hypothetical protein [Flammeovirga aprica]|uniref:Uncharacterized protein n=1 Tax=Flammeovirga aprica JL-4 TaxID=694437 RepID=A0A7X9P3M3_9BACT|nr:hypothetical protein [Flammeovirga aprica]NME68099.1 hypothetical protein [Flammeovirga aprica JL-4]